MDVTFSLTKEERLRTMSEWLGRVTDRETRGVPPWMNAKSITIASLIVGAGVMAWQMLAYPSAVLDSVQDLGYIILLPLVALGLYRIVVAVWRERPVNEAEHTISIGPAAIVRVIDGKTAEIPWDDVTDIRFSDIAIVIMTEHYLDVVIPRRAFADPVKSISFYRQAFNYWQPAEPVIAPSVDPTVWPPPPAPPASTNG